MLLLRRSAGLVVFLGIVLGGLELALHAYPELIPLTLLKRFHHVPRGEIAQRRSLWNASQMRPLERDDGGPALTLFKPHSRIWYDFHGQGEKGFTEMDAQGFCNPARDAYDRPKIDVIAIGDSFTWCVVLSPESTWTSQLGELSGRSVYNLGRGGIGPYEYLQIFKNLGLSKRPDYVIMNIYEGNDLRDAVRYWEHVRAAQEGRVLYADAADRGSREIDIDASLDFPLFRSSYALNLLLAVADKAYEGAKNAVERAIGGDAPERIDFRYTLELPGQRVAFNPQNADEGEVRFARRLRSGEIELTALDAALAELTALARQHGFVPIVAYSPSAYTAYADYVHFQDPSLQELMPWFSHAQRSFLQERSERYGYVFADLTPALQAAGRLLGAEDLLYHPINVHYTVKGNLLVARALADLISARGGAKP